MTDRSPAGEPDPDAALVLARVLTDSGHRTSLDDVIAAFGYDRAELDAELDADLAAGRE